MSESSSTLSTDKLALPAFLKMLTSSGMSMGDAMGVTKKIFPTYHSPAQLSTLTPVKLIELHVDSKEQRGLILTAIKKAGYVAPKGTKRKAEDDGGVDNSGSSSRAGGSSSKSGLTTSPPSKASTKRPRRKDPSPPLPELNSNIGERESIVPGGFNFDEILDEETLKTKSTHANRAPVMTAWATVVAERLGFKREEALSIASVYTEMNATSKGVSLGIYAPSKNSEYESGSTQPFVELMGRKIPVLENESGQWRGIVKGSPVDPAQPYQYIQRAFLQTIPWVLGSMRLLAHAYTVKEINEVGYSLYCDFRPESAGWGKKAEMRMEKILSLRKASQGNVDGGEGKGKKPDGPELQNGSELGSG